MFRQFTHHTFFTFSTDRNVSFNALADRNLQFGELPTKHGSPRSFQWPSPLHYIGALTSHDKEKITSERGTKQEGWGEKKRGREGREGGKKKRK